MFVKTGNILCLEAKLESLHEAVTLLLQYVKCSYDAFYKRNSYTHRQSEKTLKKGQKALITDIWDTAVSTDVHRLQILWLYWQTFSSGGQLEDRKWSCCCRDWMVWWPAVRIYGQIIKGYIKGSWKRNKMCIHEHSDAVTEVWQQTFPGDVCFYFVYE